MSELQMGTVEARFAKLIWDNEPVTASELAKLAAVELSWKKTTSYTALKRLCDKGIFRNDSGTVTSILREEEYYARRSHQFLEDTYQGSLPAFIAAFAGDRRISKSDLAEIRKMLDEYEQGV